MVKITSLEFTLIYADDFDTAVAFYEKHFGFKEAFKMQDTSHGPQTWGKTGDVGMWIGGGYKRKALEPEDCHSATMLGVESAFKLFDALKEDGVTIYQNEPVEMQDGIYWFQFQDPAGNILEILGPK